MRDQGLQHIEAIVERQQCMTAECDDRRLLDFGKGRGMRGLRPSLQILDHRLLTPFCHRLRVDPSSRLSVESKACACCTAALTACVVASDRMRSLVTYLTHTALFHSTERIAPSDRGSKHLTVVDLIETSKELVCQSASKKDPLLASKRDPLRWAA